MIHRLDAERSGDVRTERGLYAGPSQRYQVGDALLQERPGYKGDPAVTIDAPEGTTVKAVSHD